MVSARTFSAGTPERKRLYRREHFLVAARRKNPVLPSSKVTSPRWRRLWENKSPRVMHARAFERLNAGQRSIAVAFIPGTGETKERDPRAENSRASSGISSASARERGRACEENRAAM